MDKELRRILWEGVERCPDSVPIDNEYRLVLRAGVDSKLPSPRKDKELRLMALREGVVGAISPTASECVEAKLCNDQASSFLSVVVCRDVRKYRFCMGDPMGVETTAFDRGVARGVKKEAAAAATAADLRRGGGDRYEYSSAGAARDLRGDS